MKYLKETKKTAGPQRLGESELMGLVMRHEHDCAACKPLGQFLNNDLYFCDAAEDTVVVRYGSGHDQYFSGLHLTGMPEIKVAVAMAKAAKFIDA